MAFSSQVIHLYLAQNSITRILDSEGQPASNLSEMKQLAVVHFSQLLECMNRTRSIIDLNIDIPIMVSREVNA